MLPSPLTSLFTVIIGERYVVCTRLATKLDESYAVTLNGMQSRRRIQVHLPPSLLSSGVKKGSPKAPVRWWVVLLFEALVIARYSELVQGFEYNGSHLINLSNLSGGFNRSVIY